MLAEGYYWARLCDGQVMPVLVEHLGIDYHPDWPYEHDVLTHGVVWVLGKEYSYGADELGVVEFIPAAVPTA